MDYKNLTVFLGAIAIVSGMTLGSLVLLNAYPPTCTNPGCPPTESLALESSQVNSPTSVTLNIRNLGREDVTFISYYVKDLQDRQYANTNWSGPTIPRDTLVAVSIFMDGTAFTFQSGNTYTITTVTTRNNQFIFTINN